jgi:hypothetical protein
MIGADRGSGSGATAPKQGSRAFLRFDSPSRGRVLEPGIVEAVGDDSWTLVFESRHHAVETGERRLVYYTRSRRFVEQPVLVESQTSDGPPYVLTLKSIGEPAAAEVRSEDRVDASDSGLEATLDGEASCPIRDVSLSGLAVVSCRAFPIGRSLEVAIRYGSEEFAGEMEVRCASAQPDGSTRYGLLGVFDTPQGRSLKNGLTKMTLDIQQRRLQRIAGSS